MGYYLTYTDVINLMEEELLNLLSGDNSTEDNALVIENFISLSEGEIESYLGNELIQSTRKMKPNSVKILTYKIMKYYLYGRKSTNINELNNVLIGYKDSIKTLKDIRDGILDIPELERTLVYYEFDERIPRYKITG